MGFDHVAIKRPWWRQRWVAAASVGAMLALGATAGFLFTHHSAPEAVVAAAPAPVAAEQPVGLHVLDFKEAALPAVVAEIAKVYGVEVIGLPAKPETYLVTIHYEGDVEGLVAALNETLDIHLKLDRK